MIAVDIFIVVVVVAGVVAGITALSSSRAQKRELAAGPTEAYQRAIQRLSMAVRLLDRVVAADDVLPSLPSDIRNDIKAFVANYYAGK